MLPASLRLLIALQMRARIRRIVRGAKTIKGAIYLVVMMGLFFLWIGPSVVFGFVGPRTEPELVRSYLASGLFVYCLLSLATMGPESGVYFLPAEVDFLFAGPFRRRQLLAYRLAVMGIGCLVMALVFSVFLLRHVSYWVAGYVGAFLAIAFVVALQTALALVIAMVAEQAYTRGRRLVLALLGIGVALGAWSVLRHTGGAAPIELLRQIPKSRPGVILLAPFEVFARTITAKRLVPDFLAWGTLSLAIDAALVAIVLRIDSDFLENSIKTSQKLYDKIQRARSGGALANMVKAGDTRWRVPPLPWLAGAGPVAWRQLMTAMRSTRGLLIVLAIIGGASIAPMLLTPHRGGAPLAALWVPIVMVSAFFLPQLLQFDFRSDIDRLDVLKSLPVSATAVVVGQLVAPIAMASLVQGSLLAALAASGRESFWLLAGLAMILPFINLLIFGIENLAFLLFPTRTAAVGTGDFQAVGRQMLMMFVKLTAMMLTGGFAAAIGGAAWYLAGQSQVAFFAGAATTVALLGLALIPCLALAFRRFDPSLDTP